MAFTCDPYRIQTCDPACPADTQAGFGTVLSQVGKK
jgi:hypothetical protein